MNTRDQVGELTEEELIYRENILDHYKNPRNKLEMLDPTFHCEDINRSCGDAITVFVKLKSKIIEKVTFQGYGCAISQASISMLTEKLAGKSLEDVKNITQDNILEMLGIPIGVVRMKCAMLAIRTLQKGIKEAEA